MRKNFNSEKKHPAVDLAMVVGIIHQEIRGLLLTTPLDWLRCVQESGLLSTSLSAETVEHLLINLNIF